VSADQVLLAPSRVASTSRSLTEDGCVALSAGADPSRNVLKLSSYSLDSSDELLLLSSGVATAAFAASECHFTCRLASYPQ